MCVGKACWRWFAGRHCRNHWLHARPNEPRRGRVALVLREWEANMRTATVVAVISIALSVTGPAAAQVDRSDTEHDRTILTLKSRQ
jgi:hypothetical protein